MSTGSVPSAWLDETWICSSPQQSLCPPESGSPPVDLGPQGFHAFIISTPCCPEIWAPKGPKQSSPGALRHELPSSLSSQETVSFRANSELCCPWATEDYWEIIKGLGALLSKHVQGTFCQSDFSETHLITPLLYGSMSLAAVFGKVSLSHLRIKLTQRKEWLLKCRFLDPLPDLLNLNFCMEGSGIYCSNKLPHWFLCMLKFENQSTLQNKAQTA